MVPPYMSSFYYNKDRPSVTIKHNKDSLKILEGIAVEEIVEHLRAEKEKEGISVFKLIDICKLYSDRLNVFGIVLEN